MFLIKISLRGSTMSAKVTNQYGNIEIDNQVIAQVVYRAAMESYGLVGLAYKSKGIVELLKGENATKGVRVEEVEEDAIAIELYVIIQYGTNISTVANNIIDRVKYVAMLFPPFGRGRPRFSVMREGLCGFSSARDRGFSGGCLCVL